MSLVRKYFPYLFSLVIPLIFFGRLFFPEPKIFYTPDFAASDIWNFNYPFKDFLSRSLRNWELPFWTKEIATGTPLFAESVIGGLYSLNLLLFGLLPTWLAWNLSYVIHFFLGLIGSYLFFRRFGLSIFACLFSAFSFIFGGFFICHLQHFSPVQTASLMPWIFLLGDRLWVRLTRTNLLVFALLLSQQIFVGFVQVPFITLIGLSLFLIGQMRERDVNRLVKKIGFFALAVIFALAIAAPQILPSAEFKDFSVRKYGLSQPEIFQFPYQLKNLVTFVIPNAFGTPKDGTYPSPFSKNNLGIYWENTAYMGLLPVLFLLLSVFHRKKRRWEKSFWFLAIFSLLLALGKSSPLSFLYRYPIVNNFRVPSRFLLLTSFSVAALAGVGFDMLLRHVREKKMFASIASVLPYGIIFLTVVDVFVFSYSYNPLVPVTKALEPPASASFLEDNGRIYTHFSQGELWNSVFFERGWVDVTPYMYFKNGMDADLNMLFDREHVAAHTAVPTMRQSIQNKFLPKLINTMAAQYIISPKPLDEGDVLKLIGTVEPQIPDLPYYHIYLNKKSLNRFRFASRYVVPQNIADLNNILERNEFSFEDTVVLEKDLGESFEMLKESDITVLVDKEQHLVLMTRTDKKSIFVIADSFYPGWEAWVNKRKVPIYPANINQKALVVPAGESLIEMKFIPHQFYIGVLISIISFIIFSLFSISRIQKVVNKVIRERLRCLR